MTIDLAALGSVPAIVINGEQAGDQSGISVAGAGDFNGDGFSDFVIGASHADADNPARNTAGRTYVVFGGPGLGATIELADIAAGIGGFVIQGADAGDLSGKSVSSAGDFNGDGFGDLLVGAISADGPANSRNGAGEAYVIFGHSGVFPTVELADVEAGIGGFAIYGKASQDLTGASLAALGDVNGDGYDDIILGAPWAEDSSLSSKSGQSYVLYGHAGTGSLPVDLVTVATSSTGGFALNGIDLDDFSGISVSSVGDMNGDGFDDFVIGAYGGDGSTGTTSKSGEAYVVFGQAGIVGAPVALATIASGVGGFVLFGEDAQDYAGLSVAGAGDVNGDGFDDLIIGGKGGDGPSNGRSNAGASYVVFGHGGPYAPSISLGSLSGSDGFVIHGEENADRSGRVSSAGDVNGDGYDDLLIGAYFADGPGNSRLTAGATYVVFGHGGPFLPAVDLVDIAAGIGGFVIHGAVAGDKSGQTVAAAGDIDGDGFDDLIVGAPSAMGASTTEPAGASYVIFGSYTIGTAFDHVTHPGTPGPDSLGGPNVGTDDDIVGGGKNDVLLGEGGADTLRGGEGNDLLVIGRHGQAPGLDDSNFHRVTGGLGDDVLGLAFHMPVADAIVDADFRRIEGIESIWLDNFRINLTLGPIAERSINWLPSDPYKIVIDGTSVINAGVHIDGSALVQNMHVDLSNNFGQIWMTGSAGDDWIHGGHADDDIATGGGNDTILAASGGGNDRYDGGTGTDTIYFSSSTQGVVVDLSAATNQATGLEIDTDQLSNIENVVGGSGSDKLNGDAADNLLDGATGNDLLRGRRGSDIFRFAWQDVPTKEFDRVRDFVDGTDRLDMTLVAGLDEFADLAISDSAEGGALVGFEGHTLLLQGVMAAQLDASDFLFAAGQSAQAVDDRWYLSRGTTAMVSPMALLANDSGHGTLSIESVGNAANVTVELGAGGLTVQSTSKPGASLARYSYTMSDGTDSDKAMVEISLVKTSERADTFTVSTLAGERSFIDGFGGADKLTGGDGRDQLMGGDGTDRLFGMAGDDRLSGGAGGDLLDGGLGIDRMAGDLGNDRYMVDDQMDMVEEVEGGGSDLVESTANYVLPDQVEKLTLLGTANLAGTGNELTNEIIGNDAWNVLKGLAGNDRLEGRGGSDMIEGGGGRDIMSGGGDGPAGAGGPGGDIFVLRDGDTGVTKNDVDVILDFTTGVDRIDLPLVGGPAGFASSLYDETTAGASFASTFTAAAAEMADGEQRAMFVAGTSYGWLFWSTDADNTSIEQAVQLNGATSLDKFAVTDLM